MLGNNKQRDKKENTAAYMSHACCPATWTPQANL
jgi:hypothetical protein